MKVPEICENYPQDNVAKTSVCKRQCLALAKLEGGMVIQDGITNDTEVHKDSAEDKETYYIKDLGLQFHKSPS